MYYRTPKIVLILTVTFLFGISALGQAADNSTPLFPTDPEKRDQPKSIRDMMAKMRIESEKKEYDAMLKRGEDALKLSDELEASLADGPQLTGQEREKLEKLEKLVKKIRSDLGGDDDDEGVEPETEERPTNVVDGLKSLKKITVRFVDELKKTTRFSISAAAIQTSNAVLRLTRFLRFTR